MALVATKLMVNQLAHHPFDFKFPCLLTALHFFCVWMVTVAYFTWKADAGKCLPGSLGSLRRYFSYMFPIAGSTPMSILFDNQSLMCLGPGLNSVFTSCNPVGTAALSHCCGRRLNTCGWLGVVVASAGGIVIVVDTSMASSTTSSLQRRTLYMGFLFAVLSMVFRSIKVVVQDMLMNIDAYIGEDPPEVTEGTPRAHAKPVGPMHVWALQAPPCVLVSLVYALAVESPVSAYGSLTTMNGLLIIASCLCACCVNFLGMCAVQSLGATLSQIVGAINTILTAIISVLFFGETLPGTVLFGSALVLLGGGIVQRSEPEGSSK
jgi:drug/metabolite transporter (DMT)-like permease